MEPPAAAAPAEGACHRNRGRRRLRTLSAHVSSAAHAQTPSASSAEQKEAELNGELSQAQSAMEVVSSKRRAQLQTEDKSPEATKRLEELGEDERQKKHAVEQVQSRLDATTAALRAWREAAASGRA